MSSVTRRGRAALAPALLCVAGIGLHLARINSAPDVVFDETVYARTAYFAGHGGNLTWGDGPVFIHPPIYFLIQSLWLRIVGAPGAAGDALFDTISRARPLNALVAGLVPALVFLLAQALLRRDYPRGWVIAPGPRSATSAALVAGVIAVLDPVLVRYGRLVIIEPFAEVLCLTTILVAVRTTRRGASWVVVVGTLSGLCLLTKELSIFWITAPLLVGLLRRDRAMIRRGLAALTWAVSMWGVVFAGWAVWLGETQRFLDGKLFSLKRLLGLVQATGLNRSGVSPVQSVMEKAPIYAASYIVLAVGGLCLLPLFARFLRTQTENMAWLTALTALTYAYALYTVLFGQFNEQFFFYVQPFAALSAGCVAFAAPFMPLRPAGWARVAALSVVLTLAASSYWNVYVSHTSRAFRALSTVVREQIPRCSIVNTSGEIGAWQASNPEHQFTNFGDGDLAFRNGVEWFLLSPKAARYRYPNMNPELEAWIRSRGTRVAAFPSLDFEGYELYHVPSRNFDVTDGDGGHAVGGRSVFVSVDGNFCGGFSVSNEAAPFLSTIREQGGFAESGIPLSRPWRDKGRWSQLFASEMLTQDESSSVSPAPVIAHLYSRPDVTDTFLLEHDLPARSDPDRVRSPGDDKRIAAVWSQAPARWGVPITTAQRRPDGRVQQAFSNGVLEVLPGAFTATPSDLSRAIVDAGLLPAPALVREVPIPSSPAPMGPSHAPLAYVLVTLSAIFVLGSAVAFGLRPVRRSGQADRISRRLTKEPAIDEAERSISTTRSGS